MTNFHEVAVRCGLYILSLLQIIFIAEYGHVLAVFLSATAACVAYHAKTPVPYSILSAIMFSLATTIIVKASSFTLWFYRPVEYVSIPYWLPALYVILAHAYLDLHWTITWADLRQNALP